MLPPRPVSHEGNGISCLILPFLHSSCIHHSPDPASQLRLVPCTLLQIVSYIIVFPHFTWTPPGLWLVYIANSHISQNFQNIVVGDQIAFILFGIFFLHGNYFILLKKCLVNFNILNKVVALDHSSKDLSM